MCQFHYSILKGQRDYILLPRQIKPSTTESSSLIWKYGLIFGSCLNCCQEFTCSMFFTFLKTSSLDVSNLNSSSKTAFGTADLKEPHTDFTISSSKSHFLQMVQGVLVISSDGACLDIVFTRSILNRKGKLLHVHHHSFNLYGEFLEWVT